MNRFLCCLALLCLLGSTPAHTQSNPLSIGSSVPDVAFTEVINHPAGKAKLSDYKGQLVILDFWATWCSPCLAMFPKSDSLNKVFEGSATILPVTYQSKEEVSKLFTKSAKLNSIRMPVVVSDKALHDLFPHHELPHYVWIDGQGIVRAITGHKEVTAGSIEAMIGNSTTALEEKKDSPILPYEHDLPLLFNAVEFSPQDLTYASIFTQYKEGFASRMDVVRYADKSMARFTATNYGLKDLYAHAYTSEYGIYGNQILVEVKDKSAPFFYPDKTTRKEVLRQWEKDNLVCYELMIPNAISASFRQMMQEDLARVYPEYKASLQKRETRVLAIVRTSSMDKVKTSGKPFHLVTDPFELAITNYPIAILFNILNSKELSHLKVPVINETGMTGNIDLYLKGKMSDLENLRSELKKYDLDLVYKTQPIDMLVITDTH